MLYRILFLLLLAACSSPKRNIAQENPTPHDGGDVGNSSIRCDEGLLEVIDPKAKSLKQTDMRISDDMDVFLRIGDNIYLMQAKDGELEMAPIFDRNSLKVSEVKTFCKKIECDSGLKEVYKSYHGLLLSRSKTERIGFTAMRFSDDLKNIFIRIGDRVYFFKGSASGDDLEKVKMFGVSSLETATIKKACNVP